MRLHKNTKIDLIKSAPLFARCSKKELTAIATEADELDVPAGRDLARQGERGREFIILIEGSAEVRKNGRRINALGAGDFLGEIALLTDGMRTATVTTTSPSHLLVLTDRAFRRVTDTVPTVSLKVAQALAERLHRDTV
jgi:CRP-like cAMP-binding protein